MNKAYHELMMSRIKAAIDAAKAIQTVDHPSVKGRLREIVISELLTPLLPSDVGLGTGKIVTSDNCQSREVDIVMYDKRILPPILFQQTAGIFPIEAVLFAIEVKSVLTAAGLKDAIGKAAGLEKLTYLSGDFDDEDHSCPHQFLRLIPCVFAFDSDLTGANKSELARYQELTRRDGPKIGMMCIVGKGCWRWVNGRGWVTWSQDYELGEVASFIAGILNTYRKISESRHGPRLGDYLLG